MVTLYRSGKSNSNQYDKSKETLEEIKRLEFKINELTRLIRGFIGTDR